MIALQEIFRPSDSRGVEETGGQSYRDEARTGSDDCTGAEAYAAVDAGTGAGAEEDGAVNSNANAEEGTCATAQAIGPAQAGKNEVAWGGGLGVVGREESRGGGDRWGRGCGRGHGLGGRYQRRWEVGEDGRRAGVEMAS